MSLFIIITLVISVDMTLLSLLMLFCCPGYYDKLFFLGIMIIFVCYFFLIARKVK